MSDRLDELVRAEQVRDMFRQAEHLRLVRQAQATRQRAPARRYSAALAQLGRWLELWGCRLQARYGGVSKPGIVSHASHSRNGRP